ncbi:MAG: hypothetical protein M3O22_07080 [Pseudomonadota bacterium]|nr:hypothetical protein [Pseudomonadota bacterium]
MAQSDTIEQTSILTYAIMDSLREFLDRLGQPDDIILGMIMGLAMYADDSIGPMRSERLFRQAPGIVLKTDAHVSAAQLAHSKSLLEAFGKSLSKAAAAAREKDETA